MTTVTGGLPTVENAIMDRVGSARAVGLPARATMRRPEPSTMRPLSISVGDREIAVRLEAIEARLSAIERLLREQRGEEEVS